MNKIRTALISVWDKTNIVDLAQFLIEKNIKIYSFNKDSVLEMLGRFTEDLSSLQKAIRNNDTQLLEKIFTSTKEIRKLIEEAGQAGTFDPTESNKDFT